MLWPNDDPAKTGHRLSVLLSIVKTVLDPDRALPADHFLVADQASIGLDETRLRIDVEEFLTDVGHGRRLRERGATAEVYRLLNRMLFRAATPDERYRVFQRFYGLSQGLIERFYADRLTRYDRMRILVGKPPVPFGRALAVVRESAVTGAEWIR
jgi:hypothetical protein